MENHHDGDIASCTEADIEKAAHVLSLAFADDPVITWMFNDPDRQRARIGHAFETWTRRIFLPKHGVFFHASGHAAACWAPPAHWKLTVTQQLRLLPSMAHVFGVGRLPTVLSGMQRMADVHPDEQAHWYLSFVGTEPDHQGRGFGSTLLDHTLDRCDRDRVPAYLEASGADRLTFELDSNGDSTTFALIHTFDDRSGAASFATGWDQCLAGLRSVLAGEPLPPPDRGIARHEALVHDFGLDQPEVTESDGRWTVRVERQLTCPAEVAWDLWFGKDRDTGEQRTAPEVGEPLTPYMAPDVVIGTMTEVELHRVLAFDVAPAGGPGEHVRVELTDGTGHGARVVLTVTGTEPAERDAAVQMWGTGAVGHLAAAAAEWALAQPIPARQ